MISIAILLKAIPARPAQAKNRWVLRPGLGVCTIEGVIGEVPVQLSAPGYASLKVYLRVCFGKPNMVPLSCNLLPCIEEPVSLPVAIFAGAVRNIRTLIGVPGWIFSAITTLLNQRAAIRVAVEIKP